MGKTGGLVKTLPKTVPKTLPKTECCVSSTRCERCPIRMLKDGTLPEGFGVRKRKLVRVTDSGKLGKKKVKKAEVAAAMKSRSHPA